MMKFIDDRGNDPCNRLELMLDLMSQLLPGTEVYKLYDLILSTCADPTLAYMHLSIVAVLADPLPISQILELLGPGQGRDVEKVLMQLRDSEKTLTVCWEVLQCPEEDKVKVQETRSEYYQGFGLKDKSKRFYENRD
ncbi:hypothetical protein BDR07DRAFT_1461967 [Suillus spraguei]|nr:hypothetical protein BDR07DRAFT_1461967 [Suillus spraguei]